MFLLCSHLPMRTRADLLRFAIAYALIKARKVVQGLRQGTSEDERFEAADAVVHRLQERGDPWRLSEQLREHLGGTYWLVLLMMMKRKGGYEAFCRSPRLTGNKFAGARVRPPLGNKFT